LYPALQSNGQGEVVLIAGLIAGGGGGGRAAGAGGGGGAGVGGGVVGQPTP